MTGLRCSSNGKWFQWNTSDTKMIVDSICIFHAGENQYRIPKGAETNGTVDEMQDAEKRIRVTELPDMLCFTLKRFSFDVATASMTKVN